MPSTMMKDEQNANKIGRREKKQQQQPMMTTTSTTAMPMKSRDETDISEKPRAHRRIYRRINDLDKQEVGVIKSL